MAHRIHINAVAYQEGDAWIAQGIEYDIVAHALDKSALADAFGRAVMENIIITQHLGREPLEGVKPAPEHFKELFDSARDEALPPSYVDGAEVSVRVAA